MAKTGKLICPVFDETCPYCKKGFCHMYEMEGVSPIGECDAWIDDEEED